MDSSTDDHPLVGAPFLGFMAGCILFGVTILQVYQYFLNYIHDSKWRKILILAVCSLDSIHLAFSSVMIYYSLSNTSVLSNTELLWALKGFATSKALLIVLVQSYYLYITYIFAGNITLNHTLSKCIQYISVLIFLYAIVIATVFLAFLEGISSFSNFSKGFQTMIYVGFGSTAGIDSSIALAMSFLLCRTSPNGHNRSRSVVQFLVLFFIGTGLLTAVSAIATISVYIARPSTVLYLSIEFSVPRLYANSLLAMFNSKSRLRKRMQATSQLKISSALLFGDFPEQSEATADVDILDSPA